ILRGPADSKCGGGFRYGPGGPTQPALRGVEALLGRREPVVSQRLDRVSSIRQKIGQHASLGRAEVTEHEVGGRLTPGWAADADAHAQKLGGSRGLDDVAEAVVAAVAAAPLQPNGVERDVELVVDDDELLDRDLVETQEPGDGSA